jgi:hypothetical protein
VLATQGLIGHDQISAHPHHHPAGNNTGYRPDRSQAARW